MATAYFDVTERSSARYTATLLDENGDPVERDALDSLRLWLYEVRSNEVINARDNQDVLTPGDHGVTFGATDGVLTWQLEPDDNAIVRATQNPVVEYHEAVFQAAWSGGGKTWKVPIRVSNMTPVPAAP